MIVIFSKKNVHIWGVEAGEQEGDSTTLVVGDEASHMGQFNTGMGPDWSGICV
jgi:hypothetical protein